MDIDYTDIAQAILAREALKAEGIHIKFQANAASSSLELIQNKPPLVHRLTVTEKDAARARQVLLRHGLIM